jgi:malate dehydrogenase (oxaloacetate-decarboxylating)
VSLDVGTDNAALLEDPLYLGWRHRRVRGGEYDSLVDEFVDAVRRRFPRVLLQWEDFKKANAFRVLDRYRTSILSFNDDIQGTGAVAVAGILAGTRATGVPLARQKVVILGAGGAGIGIARLLRATLRQAGVEGESLAAAIAVLDTGGLLVNDREISEAHKRDFAWPAELAARHGLGRGRPSDLEAVVRAVRPTVLVGVSGQGGLFTEPVIRALAGGTDRPIVLPMSNPTSKAEARPADVLQWSDGRALVATGSPFEPVDFGGRHVRIGQSNNAFVFPGLGLGVLVSGARVVTDGMFAAAAQRLAGEVTDEDLRAGSLFPAQSRIRAVQAAVAEAVVQQAQEEGQGEPFAEAAIPVAVRAAMWDPRHPEVLAVPLEVAVQS